MQQRQRSEAAARASRVPTEAAYGVASGRDPAADPHPPRLRMG